MCGNFRVSSALFRHRGFLQEQECLFVRQAMNRGTVEAAEILNVGIHHQLGIRNASLVEPAADVIEFIERRVEMCRQDVAAALSMTLGEREGAGFIRYPSGGFYKPHRDRGTDAHWPSAARRAAAVVIFLNSSRQGSREAGEFDGGVLRLFLPDAEEPVAPEAGLMVAFPADVLHEVTEVRGGTRDSVVDWFYF
jgi:predicted 2-oxoglutarate/Fe(II)-dependent dioxygenase YbiX